MVASRVVGVVVVYGTGMPAVMGLKRVIPLSVLFNFCFLFLI